MTFVQNARIDGVELGESCKVDVGDDTIENEAEMISSFISSIQIVLGRYAVEVVNIFSDGF